MESSGVILCFLRKQKLHCISSTKRIQGIRSPFLPAFINWNQNWTLLIDSTRAGILWGCRGRREMREGWGWVRSYGISKWEPWITRPKFQLAAFHVTARKWQLMRINWERTTADQKHQQGHPRRVHWVTGEWKGSETDAADETHWNAYKLSESQGKLRRKAMKGGHFTTFLYHQIYTHVLGCKRLYFTVPVEFSLIMSFKTRKTKGMAQPVFHSVSTKFCFQMLRNQQFPTFRLHKSQGVHQLIARNGNRNSQEMPFQKLIQHLHLEAILAIALFIQSQGTISNWERPLSQCRKKPNLWFWSNSATGF